MTLIGSTSTGAGDAGAGGTPTASYRTGAQSVRTEGELGGSSPPEPQPVTLDMWLWNRADTLVTRDAFDFVGAWGDKSGNNHGSTTAAISGPLWHADGINGLPSIRFAGSNALQNLTDSIPLGERTLMFVARPRTNIGGALMAFSTGAAPRDWVAYSWLFGGTQYLWSDGLINIAATAAVDYSSAPHLYVFEQSATNVLTCRVDLTLLGTAPNPAITTNESGNPGYSMGGRQLGSFLQGFDGDISDALIYARLLDAPEYAQNLTYVRERYGVAV